jgi:hypothetical protein
MLSPRRRENWLAERHVSIKNEAKLSTHAAEQPHSAIHAFPLKYHPVKR